MDGETEPNGLIAQKVRGAFSALKEVRYVYKSLIEHLAEMACCPCGVACAGEIVNHDAKVTLF